MQAVFAALSDPTRRRLMDRLRRDGSLSLGALADGLPMSRQAVTKHVDALCAAGLVRVRRSGRERLHELEPEPLRAVGEWLAPYAAEWDRRLDALRAYVGGEQEETPG